MINDKLEVLFKLNPTAAFDENPELICRYYTHESVKIRPKWMALNYPYWMSVFYPKILIKYNSEWVIQNKRYLMWK